MKLHFSVRDIDELFEQLQRQTGAAVHLEDGETVLQLPPPIGEGTIRQIALRPGLLLTLDHYVYPEAVSCELAAHATPSLALSFCTAGHTQGRLAGLRTPFDGCPGQLNLGFVRGLPGVLTYQPRQPLAFVELFIEPEAIYQLSGAQFEQLPKNLRRLIEFPDREGYFAQSRQTTIAMQGAIHQILHCPYWGLTRRLYLESKAIELVALAFEPPAPCGPSPTLRPEQIERICLAKEILLLRLDEPPSLLELARQVGLNDCTLKRGFRQVFATTVFGCLHQQRMERARELLLLGRLNVTEVALSVGYASLSAFNAAFKRRFGVNPGAYRKLP
ncbi:helix-turn-helix transcriptional regulator [Gloeobacter morelensis]|uniref:Helix-turn-helix transcriptional regulator n=1 Tax=Gloeobacter morelensis MG652769 TaxID=2781736 RepID=A0ABY3PMG0_9CYAN|nr:AraC family transcriptional regulator [Gloeobacter morelensis]UFP94769.1 helix-turn-helix transcriptional regulator [Gloeobacter morelensis MG652769]